MGILGGGQLAKMTAQAAHQLGCSVVVMERRQAAGEPLFGWPIVVGDWDDPHALLEFARDVDVVTLENEFVDADALAELERHGHPLWPTAESVRLVQDKLHQKDALRRAGLPLPGFRDTPTPEAVVDAATALGWPLVLKKRRNGYDGKGNATIRSGADVPTAWRRLDGDINALYAEQWCDFALELAVIVTRARPGVPHEPALVTYPVAETVQRDHICHVVKVPAALPADVAARTAEVARAAVEAVGGVGTFGVELFLLRDGSIALNELAPRAHNSGHYTIEACVCSQYENHVRAVLGRPLGSPHLLAPAAAMVNLLGAGDGPGQPDGLDDALAVAGAHVHLYGKDRSVKGRKMGHVTALGQSVEEALAVAQRAASSLRFGAG